MNPLDLLEEHLAGSPWKTGMVIYCDVDDTLIDHHDIAKPHIVRFLHDAKARGCTLFLWSQGGADYAQQHAARLGIEELFSAFLPKPDIAVDDLPFQTPYTRHFHPIQLI